MSNEQVVLDLLTASFSFKTSSNLQLGKRKKQKTKNTHREG